NERAHTPARTISSLGARTARRPGTPRATGYRGRSLSSSPSRSPHPRANRRRLMIAAPIDSPRDAREPPEQLRGDPQITARSLAPGFDLLGANRGLRIVL